MLPQQKNLRQIVLSTLIGIMLCAAPIAVCAVTDIIPSVTSATVTTGETFTVRFTLDPHGVRDFTVRLSVKFSPDILALSDFTFADGWVPVMQPGYDNTDNVRGILLKTGGYPKGGDIPVVFGVATFLVKKSGVVEIRTDENSLALDRTNTNTLNTTPLVVRIEGSDAAVPYHPEFVIPETLPVGLSFDRDLRIGDHDIDIAYAQLCLETRYALYAGRITGDLDETTTAVLGTFVSRYENGVLQPPSSGPAATPAVMDAATRAKLTDACRAEAVQTPTSLFDIIVEPGKLPGTVRSPWLLLLIIPILMLCVSGYQRAKRARVARILKKVNGSNFE